MTQVAGVAHLESWNVPVHEIEAIQTRGAKECLFCMKSGREIAISINPDDPESSERVRRLISYWEQINGGIANIGA